MRNEFEGAKVLITGGLGFIGSNLARRLAGLGAELTLVDSLIPEYGGNLFNIEGFATKCTSGLDPEKIAGRSHRDYSGLLSAAHLSLSLNAPS